MKPYIQKLIDMKLLNHKSGLALEVGSGTGEDAAIFGSLGYTVESFDKKSGTDLKDFIFEKDKYDFINCNNVLPFLNDQDAIEKALNAMAISLRKGGVLHFTLFGNNDPWTVEHKDKMSFWYFRNALHLVEMLPLHCVLKSSEEYMGKKMDGTKKYWHILRFALIKK